MRPSILWMLTATVLALAGFALQYPEIHGRRPLMAELMRDHGYPPHAWWEPIVWLLAFFAALMILTMAWLLWPQKKPSKRWRPPMEGE